MSARVSRLTRTPIIEKGLIRRFVRESHHYSLSLPGAGKGHLCLSIRKAARGQNSAYQLPAGERLEILSHAVMNAGVLMSGKLTVMTADGKTLHLKSEDAVVEVVNTPHLRH